MAGTTIPASPALDLACFADGPLPHELEAFCGSGVSVVVGVCAADGRAVAGRGFGARVHADEVRVTLERPANAPLLAALAAGSGIAVTFTLPSTHRSIQLKGGAARIEGVLPQDLAATAANCARFRAELVRFGNDDAFASTYTAYEPSELVAAVFAPVGAFTQTPGPGAGSELKP
jgi:hypothetical protein